ncbi:coiled-coil domain-containing protein 146-like isoform X1 [Pomacea canaliculata]|uniref:coiled-coil domain-containing protein 146-like isoform X1 n=2 Tax=Pomacea canaliculata TaxID=400727 RepID=UPI000D73F53E|nr:coiled-coil domain-containing protein 146-like isoform X1 [Pomacea canaliculata]
MHGLEIIHEVTLRELPLSRKWSRNNSRTMSNSEKESEMEPDGTPESSEEIYSSAISAVAPKVFQQEESQVEVSSSPAFQCLDELFQKGKLTGTKVSMFKAKYTELHETLKRMFENEKKLLREAKEFTQELEKQRVELERADNFPEAYNTEPAKLREQLLKYVNELAETEERQSRLEYKMESLREEKKILEREYERLPKQGQIEKKIKELQTAAEEMRKEIANRQMEAKNLREDLETTQRQIAMDSKDHEKLLEELEDIKAELVQVNAIPGQKAKETDKILRQKNEVDLQLQQQESEYQELAESMRQLESRRKLLEEEKLEADTELEKQRVLLDQRTRELEMLTKDFELAKEREAVLMGDRATLDMNVRHIVMEKKNQHDTHSRKSREKERDIRMLKKSELQLKVAEESLNHIQSVYEKLKAQVSTLPKGDEAQVKKRDDLQKEVEQIKRALAQQNSLTAVEHVKLEASAAEEQNLLYEQSDLRIEVVELTRLAAIKADEREQKARDFMRAEMRYHRAVEDLKTKQLQIQDHQKKSQEVQVKLKDFAKLYDVIKNERNKCVNLIQASTQKAAEMKEKIKILQNEVEILRTAVMQKERQLQKQRLKHMNSIVIRDGLRNEMAKQQHLEEEMKEKREQQKMDIAKLNLMINLGEEQMVKLRKRYEKNVQHRNDRGIKLIERNEEVCVFYEKLNIQEQMIRNGEVELKAREEEIRFMRLQSLEEQRAIDLIQQNMPIKQHLEDELVTLQIHLQQCQDRMIELERELENPYDEKRVRFLAGKDPSPAEILNKVEELESRLAEKEEQMLEKDLVLEQVQRMVDRIRDKAQAGKDDTLNLAKKVNETQGKIKEATRKMMALVSELSMTQAQAMTLQQQVKQGESELEQCYLHMEKGEPPTLSMEQEWMRFVRDDGRRQEERKEKALAEEQEEQYKLSDNVYTTAEPRPNAYIPDDDIELPIPRPYGANAPFKPSEPGSTMRHIRKPVPKPIEI